MTTLQSLIGRWHKATFPDATILEVVNKLQEELNEVQTEWEFDGKDMDAELADCAIVLLALAQRLDIDLESAIMDKMAVNYQRTIDGRWAKPE